LKRRWILAFALVAFAGSASAAPDGETPRVELPLGPYVRAGRPLDVRVVGGADRVRAPGTPWALPQGERGDEFILQLTDATVGVLALEIDRGGRIERVTQTVETLPADAVVVGVRGDGDVPAGARALRLPATGLPSVDEGWLLLDDVADGSAPAEAPAVLDLLRGMPPQARPFRMPLLFAPDGGAFVAGAKIAESAPKLPSDVALVLEVLAVAEVLLLVILRFRDASTVRRAAWLGLPPIAALAFVASPGRLPGAISATAFAVDVHERCVFVRVEARRAGVARFVVPQESTGAAMIRFSADDATVDGASAGREVVLDLRPGESRLFAYNTNLSWEAPLPAFGLDGARGGAVPGALESWLAGRGLMVSEARRSLSTSVGALPRAEGAVVIPAGEVSVFPPSK